MENRNVPIEISNNNNNKNIGIGLTTQLRVGIPNSIVEKQESDFSAGTEAKRRRRFSVLPTEIIGTWTALSITKKDLCTKSYINVNNYK
jgi:hypothetical protein